MKWVVESKQNVFHGHRLLREEMIPALAVRLNGSHCFLGSQLPLMCLGSSLFGC